MAIDRQKIAWVCNCHGSGCINKAFDLRILGNSGSDFFIKCILATPLCYAFHSLYYLISLSVFFAHLVIVNCRLQCWQKLFFECCSSTLGHKTVSFFLNCFLFFAFIHSFIHVFWYVSVDLQVDGN